MKYSAHHDPIHDQVSVVTLSFDLFICLLRQLDETRRPNSSFFLRNPYSVRNLAFLYSLIFCQTFKSFTTPY